MSGPGGFIRLVGWLGDYWTVCVLLLMVLILGFVAPGFYSQINWDATTQYATEFMLLAVGETLVIITGGIDISDGAILGFSSMAGAVLMARLLGAHVPSLPTAIIGVTAIVLAGAAAGLVNGLVITRLKIAPFIATLGMLGIATGATDLLNGGREVINLPPQLGNLGSAVLLDGWLPFPVLLTAVITAVAWIVLSRTRFGLRTYTVGSNREAARRAGLNVDRHLLRVYTISGALSGVAAVTVMARFTVASPLAGANDELSAIAAVVIGGASLFGGRGTILGSIVGTAIVSVLVTGLVLANVVPFWQVVLVGAIIIAAVYIDQTRRRVRD